MIIFLAQSRRSLTLKFKPIDKEASKMATLIGIPIYFIVVFIIAAVLFLIEEERSIMNTKTTAIYYLFAFIIIEAISFLGYVYLDNLIDNSILFFIVAAINLGFYNIFIGGCFALQSADKFMSLFKERYEDEIQFIKDTYQDNKHKRKADSLFNQLNLKSKLQNRKLRNQADIYNLKEQMKTQKEGASGKTSKKLIDTVKAV